MLKNIVIIHNEYVEIKVISKNYKHSVLMDIEDLCKIGKIRISKQGYAYQSKLYGKSITNIILNVDTNYKNHIDHLNGNTLDNRKSNLRYCSSSDNARNRHSFNRNNTGIVGIAYRENGNYKYYRATITTKNNKRITKQFNINKLSKNIAFLKAQEWLTTNKIKENYII